MAILDRFTWVDDAGVTLVDCVAAAGHSVANRGALERTLTTDDVILTAAPTHDVPFWARAVVIQVPVVWEQTSTPGSNTFFLIHFSLNQGSPIETRVSFSMLPRDQEVK